ncbi:MAG: F0F1 ATP synthase subunit delta [Candidatus Paceibacterota bacterium]|jgi:F0F1-type ATP synthase delta subunit
MKFTPQQFANAFVEAIQEARLLKTEPGSRASEAEIIARAADILKKAGKENKLPQIILAIESAWAKKTGARKFTLRSTLPLKDNAIKSLTKALQLTDRDSVETHLDPHLVAGVIVSENESRVLDLSFRSRVNKLFATA